MGFVSCVSEMVILCKLNQCASADFRVCLYLYIVKSAKSNFYTTSMKHICLCL